MLSWSQLCRDSDERVQKLWTCIYITSAMVHGSNLQEQLVFVSRIVECSYGRGGQLHYHSNPYMRLRSQKRTCIPKLMQKAANKTIRDTVSRSKIQLFELRVSQHAVIPENMTASKTLAKVRILTSVCFTGIFTDESDKHLVSYHDRASTILIHINRYAWYSSSMTSIMFLPGTLILASDTLLWMLQPSSRSPMQNWGDRWEDYLNSIAIHSLFHAAHNCGILWNKTRPGGLLLTRLLKGLTRTCENSSNFATLTRLFSGWHDTRQRNGVIWV